VNFLAQPDWNRQLWSFPRLFWLWPANDCRHQQQREEGESLAADYISDRIFSDQPADQGQLEFLLRLLVDQSDTHADDRSQTSDQNHTDRESQIDGRWQAR